MHAGDSSIPRGSPGSSQTFWSRKSDLMKRVLLTGISGVGKSTVIGVLAARGYKAVDLDSGEWSEWVEIEQLGASGAVGTPVEPGRDWVWREDRVQALLSAEDTGVLFVSGCSPNMGKFYAQLDQVVLLTAPPAVIVERLAARTNNPYGRRPEEVARVLDLLESVEPVLRKGAGHEIHTSIPLEEVVAEVLRIVDAVT